MTDGEIRAELLRALRRMSREQGANSRSDILTLDLAGIADVLRVPVVRVRENLSDLLTEGLAEPYAPSFGHGAEDGSCRITALGMQAIRQLDAPKPAQVPAQSQTFYIDRSTGVSIAQTGTGNIYQQPTIGATPGDVLALVSELREVINELPLTEDDREAYAEPVEQLEAELQRPAPRRARIVAAWSAIQGVTAAEGLLQANDRVQRLIVDLAPKISEMLSQLSSGGAG